MIWSWSAMSVPVAASALLCFSPVARKWGVRALSTPLHAAKGRTSLGIGRIPRGGRRRGDHQRHVSAESSHARFLSTTVVTAGGFTSSQDSDAREEDQATSDDVHVGGVNRPMRVNVHTVPEEELRHLLELWGHEPYRAGQVLHWVRQLGCTDFDQMANIPKGLRSDLKRHAAIGTLELAVENVSRDGTKKRAYRLEDGQLIESVLMPYDDGRNTACISSQAGCAMGCVFCATGQMGFARQLTSDEIFEQVARFDSELKTKGQRVSNVVMMGMGEPLANYRNVMAAVRKMNDDLGIGARKITISTVGIVPNIRKLMEEDIQVRLAISLHCSSDEERSKLLPANRRYGGLDELMATVREYTERTRRRITFEWALIEGENDTEDVAIELGELIRRHNLRRDFVHVNLIPLNPTGGFAGSPSGRMRVNKFVAILQEQFGISATPRVRRGIDIDAGCGQLKAAVKKQERNEEVKKMTTDGHDVPTVRDVDFLIDEQAFDFDADDDSFEDVVYESREDLIEAERLLSLVSSSCSIPSTAAEPITTTITDEQSVREAKKRRKKLLKNLKAIAKLYELEKNGKELNEEQNIKLAKEKQWRGELESVEHNLQ